MIAATIALKIINARHGVIGCKVTMQRLENTYARCLILWTHWGTLQMCKSVLPVSQEQRYATIGKSSGV